MLRVDDISKSYRNTTALKAVSLTVEAGEVVAVVGPNGAGKSTLFNILAGVLDKDGGSATLDGSSLDALLLSEMGFLPEEPYIYDRLDALQMLQFEATMRHIDPSRQNQRELLRRFAIEAYESERMGSLSQGMAKRVLLAAAFLGNPSLLILDEPLNGLDIQTVIALKEQLLIEKQHGAHVLVSSHVLSFLDETADKVLFLDKGELVGESWGEAAHAESIYRQLFID